MLLVVGAFSLAAGLPPQALAFATSLAASLAFMMPIGTAPYGIESRGIFLLNFRDAMSKVPRLKSPVTPTVSDFA